MIKRIANLSILFLLSVLQLQAQSRKQLEQKRKKMQQDIEYTRNILKKTSAKKSAALHNLNTLNVIIKGQEEVIGNLKEEIGETEAEIKVRNFHLTELQKLFVEEKLRMHKTIIKAYKTRKNANELAFVFASSNFRQAIKRLKYLKKLSEYRSFLIERIQEKKDSVNSGLMALQKTKTEKNFLLKDEVSEKNKLDTDKREKSKMVSSLTSQEAQLRKKIRKNEVAVNKLNATISRMIAREIEAARKRAASQAAKTGKKPTGGVTRTASSGKKPAAAAQGTVTLTPEARELSNSFAANAGVLPWPVERGYISQGYGVHAHPDLAGITLINNGVDITTNEGGSARSVFKGTVAAVINIPGQEKAVLINHGEYFTVYSRLTEVYVSRGQTVSSKQNLGKVWTDEEGKTILQFQVWKGQSKQNPANWLAGK
ncbi:MAG: peptidoglycan DD-metalloendopeptidase family protein [Bacteroidetes bacterium]|nr:peptidoglycan DD-metalloendopeptidase family protein [Bacteroidota bacterium]